MKNEMGFIQGIQQRSKTTDRLRSVTWLELFFDLVFVAAISQVGIPLAENYSLPGLAVLAHLVGLVGAHDVRHPL